MARSGRADGDAIQYASCGTPREGVQVLIGQNGLDIAKPLPGTLITIPDHVIVFFTSLHSTFMLECHVGEILVTSESKTKVVFPIRAHIHTCTHEKYSTYTNILKCKQRKTQICLPPLLHPMKSKYDTCPFWTTRGTGKNQA